MAAPAAPSSAQEQCEKGFADALRYDAHRPIYPVEAITKVLTAAGITAAGLTAEKPTAAGPLSESAASTDSRSYHVVDLAAGTGILTQQLVDLLGMRGGAGGSTKGSSSVPSQGHEIIAIEPHDSMRAVLEGKKLPGVRVVNAKAEDMTPVETGWADMVVVGQGFHWFDNETSLQEISRVLKVGGVFGMLWNIEDFCWYHRTPPSTHWEASLRALLASLCTMPHDGLQWLGAFQDRVTGARRTRCPLALPLRADEVTWQVRLTRDDIWARYRTQSPIAMLSTADGPEGDRAREVKRKVDEVFEEAERKGEADQQGRFCLSGRTTVYWTVKSEE